VGSIALLLVLPGGLLPAVLAVGSTLLGSVLLSRRDRRRYACITLMLNDCRLVNVSYVDGAVEAALVAASGSVGGLRRGRRLVGVRPAVAGLRRLPVVLGHGGAVTRWFDTGVEVPLEGREEILGALDVLAAGDGLTVEVLYASRPGAGSRVMATGVSSSAGSVLSWEPDLLIPGSVDAADRSPSTAAELWWNPRSAER